MGGLCVSGPAASIQSMADDDIRSLDRPWGLDKITMLVDGEVDFDGELHVGRSSYEMRMAAQSSSADFADLIIEAAQLDVAIQSGIQRDHEVRIAMLLRTRGGLDEAEIERLLGSSRPGYALLKRGAELVRRHERGKHSQLRRVRAQKGLSDAPVCWRCLKEEVPRPGDWCGCVDAEQKSRRSKTGPGATYDPTEQPAVSEMTDAEKAEELAKLVATQSAGPIPGGEHYRKRVNPMPVMYDPNDIRRADRAHHRGRGDDWRRNGGEVIPSG